MNPKLIMFIFTALAHAAEGAGGMKRQGVRVLEGGIKKQGVRVLEAQRLEGGSDEEQVLKIIKQINSTQSGRLPTHAIKQ